MPLLLLVPLPGALGDDVAGPVLALEVDLADVLADHAERQHLDAAHEAHRGGGGGPAGDGGAGRVRDEHPHDGGEARERDGEARPRDQADGLDRKARDAVDGQRQHLGERVVRLAGHALVALVVDARAPEAHERHHAAQEQVDLAELRQRVEGAGAQEAVVGVVVDALHAHRGEQAVEGLRREALEERVRLAARADAVDDVAAVEVGVDHGLHRRDVVLAVAVDRDGGVAMSARLHEAAEQGVLVAAVAGERAAAERRVRRRQALDELPGAVPRAVVDEQDVARGVDLALGDEVLELGLEQAARDRQDLLLVVAGDDDG